MRTVIAYEYCWLQCHVCQACLHVWDVDTTPPRTTVHWDGQGWRGGHEPREASKGEQHGPPAERAEHPPRRHCRHGRGWGLCDWPNYWRRRNPGASGSEQSRTEALKRACALAGATHCVFLYPSTGTPVHLQFVCPKVSKQAHRDRRGTAAIE